MTREVDQPGYLRPYEQTPIYTKIAGFAKEPKFDIGDRVKKGELLVELVRSGSGSGSARQGGQGRSGQGRPEAGQGSRHGGQGRQEAARADIEAKMAAINSAEAQVLRWQAEDVRSRKLVDKGIFDQQTADEIINQLRASEAVAR